MADSSQSISATSATLATERNSVNKNIFRALLSIGSAVLLIRIMGMINQVVVTARFGAGASMDSYFVAIAIPVLLSELIIGAIEASVIPVYTRLRSSGTKEQATVLFSTLLNFFLIGTVMLILLMLLFRGQVIFFSAP